MIDDLEMERSKRYVVPMKDNYFDKLESLTIELISTFGDCDLSVTVDNQTLTSRSALKFDQVRLVHNFDKINFSTPIEIVVNAKVMSHYELSLHPRYKPTVDTRLDKAKVLVERQPLQISMSLTSDEVLMAYQPWWSDHEQMSICFLVDNMQSSVYFYAALDEYPLNYATDLFDTNGILTITHDNPKYFISQSAFGTYFVRIRPTYKFANLVKDDSYKMNFYAFAQPREGDFTDLYVNQTVMGVSNSSQMPTQYRHLLIANNQTVVVTLTGIYGKGFPQLLVKLSNVQTSVYGLNVVDYDLSAGLDSTKQWTQITLDSALRQSINPLCEQAGYNNGTAGNQNCGIYIGVKCGEGESVCAYKVNLQAFEEDDQNSMVHYSPSYITWNKDYLNGAVPAGSHRYYYLPID